MPAEPISGVVVAGLSGDSGKTLVCLALALAARRAGVPVRPFKKGPDYIDAAWLSWAAGHPARNLDSWLMGFPAAVACLRDHGRAGALNLVEGNRGLFDGMDALGTHSTAELAKALGLPVLLVIDASKATRTVAACVLGCQRLDPAVRIGGVVLNSVGTARHERVLRAAIEEVCGVPVLGAIPRLRDCLLPERHLGLVTPAEHPSISALERQLADEVGAALDWKSVLTMAGVAGSPRPQAPAGRTCARVGRVIVGYLKDRAFTFYYPENLEALEAAGARLAPLDSLTASSLPEDLDALYIGGGFPETNSAAISGNPGFLRSLKAAAERGLPIYAECGGLMLLARTIRRGVTAHEMAGVLPFTVEVCGSPQGHGYVRARVDRPNPFLPVGLEIKGHEFHYSRVLAGESRPDTACAVERGTGCFSGRDGVLAGNVWAGYTHIHAVGVPEWAGGLTDAAARYRGSR